jgi:hypothetical protein
MHIDSAPGDEHQIACSVRRAITTQARSVTPAGHPVHTLTPNDAEVKLPLPDKGRMVLLHTRNN